MKRLSFKNFLSAAALTLALSLLFSAPAPAQSQAASDAPAAPSAPPQSPPKPAAQAAVEPIPGASQGLPQAQPAPAQAQEGDGHDHAAGAAPAAASAAPATLADFGPPTDANGNLKAIAKPSKLDDSDDKIEVVYFFWYGCPSCFSTDVATTMFLSSLPEDVRATKLHILFDRPPYWRIHGKLFYVLEELGVEKELHTQIFETIQTKGAPSGGHAARGLLTPESQETFAAAHGVSRAAFKAAYGSPAVNGRMERVIAFTDNSGLDGVPGFIINGRYQFSYFSGPGFYQQADRLIAMERARLAAEKEKAAQ